MLARLPRAPMGYAVLPSLSLASGPQVLLLSKLKAPINRAESTLLQVFFLRSLKPFGINTYEKQGEGSLLWLTSCYKKVSARNVRWNPILPSSVTLFQVPYPASPAFATLTKTAGVWGYPSYFGTTLTLSSRASRRGICFSFSCHSSRVTRHFLSSTIPPAVPQ